MRPLSSSSTPLKRSEPALTSSGRPSSFAWATTRFSKSIWKAVSSHSKRPPASRPLRPASTPWAALDALARLRLEDVRLRLGTEVERRRLVGVAVVGEGPQAVRGVPPGEPVDAERAAAPGQGALVGALVAGVREAELAIAGRELLHRVVEAAADLDVPARRRVPLQLGVEP